MHTYHDTEDGVRELIRRRLLAKGHLNDDSSEPEHVLGANRDEWPDTDVGSEACRNAKLDLIRGENLLDRYSIFTRPKLLRPDQLLDPMLINNALKRLYNVSKSIDKVTYYMGCIRPTPDEIYKVCMGFRTVVMAHEGDERALAALNGQTFQYAAAVLNTTTNMRGVHWVVVGVDLDNKKIEVWDPMGRQPAKNSPVWKQVNELFVGDGNLKEYGYDILMSRTKHQRGGIECGVYSIWYIWSRTIEGRSWEDIASREVPDNVMAIARREFFRVSGPKPGLIRFSSKRMGSDRYNFRERSAKRFKTLANLHSNS